MSRAVIVQRRPAAQTPSRANGADDDGVTTTPRIDAEIRQRDIDRKRSAYATYYETQFSAGTGNAGGGVVDADGPMMAAAFPRCDKTARARAAVSRCALQLYLLAEVVVASGGRCACDRAADDHDPICGCAERAAVAFQATTEEFCGGGGRRTDGEVADDDQTFFAQDTCDGTADDPTYQYMRVIARHAMSNSLCRCGDAARCLHRCLLHTMFLEKVVELYGRGPRDAATQTQRDDDCDNDAETGKGPVVAAATVATPAPAVAAATPKSTVSAAKRLGKPSKAKYIQVRYKEKKKSRRKYPPTATAAVAASPEAVPPSEPLEHACAAAAGGRPPSPKVKSSGGRGWNPFRWLWGKKSTAVPTPPPPTPPSPSSSTAGPDFGIGP